MGVVLHLIASGQDMRSFLSAAAGLDRCRFDRQTNFGFAEFLKKRRSKYGKNRNGFSSLKENWTGSTGSSG
jgi:hypothetical protein